MKREPQPDDRVFDEDPAMSLFDPQAADEEVDDDDEPVTFEDDDALASSFAEPEDDTEA